MYQSRFSHDINEMLAVLRNGGLQIQYIDFFLHDFDDFCIANYPDEDVLSDTIAEEWIHNTSSESRCHMSRRVRTMVHLGEYQQAVGKAAYVPGYRIHYAHAEEPRLFSDEQLAEFFELVDSVITNTPTFPHNDMVFPVLFRMNYSSGLRSSESCNLKVEDVDLVQGKLRIFNSKGFKDREIPISDDLCSLCRSFHNAYSSVVPNRKYFFQPSQTRECYNSSIVGKVFDSVLKKTTFYETTGKKFTAHGLRHLFAVQNIKKCAESGENFYNWMQYLCKYMGHKHIRYTMYYLHITSQLFPVYSQKLEELEERVGVVYVED